MKITYATSMLVVLASAAVAQTASEDAYTGPCWDQQEAKSPDPAESPDGFGQLVGQRGETNSTADTEETNIDGGDAYTGDPAYGDCDGR